MQFPWIFTPFLSFPPPFPLFSPSSYSTYYISNDTGTKNHAERNPYGFE